MTQVVILGAGPGGTMMANKLTRTYRDRLRQGTMGITLVKPRTAFVPKGVAYVVGESGDVRSGGKRTSCPR